MSHIEFSRTAPDGQELFYQGWLPQGDPKATICLVHGLGEHSGRYAYVGEALNDARLRAARLRSARTREDARTLGA